MKTKDIALGILLLFSGAAANNAQAQKIENGVYYTKYGHIANTVSTQAGVNALVREELSIGAKYGKEDAEVFNIFRGKVEDALNEAGIPHRFFIEEGEGSGAIFEYTVADKQYGSFSMAEFAAMLSEAARDYQKAYPHRVKLANASDAPEVP